MVPVVMDPSMRNPLLWTGILGAELGGILYIDLTSDDAQVFEENCIALGNRIKAIYKDFEEEQAEEDPQQNNSTTGMIASALPQGIVDPLVSNAVLVDNDSDKIDLSNQVGVLTSNSEPIVSAENTAIS